MAGDDSEKSREEIALESMLGLGDQAVHNISPLLHQIEPSRRTTFMQAVPEDQFTSWISPVKLLRMINKPFEMVIVIDAILNRLSLGHLLAAAESAILNSKEGSSEDQRIPVPWEFWSRSVAPDDKSPFWKLAGDITFSTGTGQGYGIDRDNWVAFTGVRFDPDGVARLLQALGVADEGVTPSPHEATGTALALPPSAKGGRPREQYWEDALVEIFDQLWHGTLTPTTQADIERTMSDHIAILVGAEGKNPSERSVRERAKKLWKAYTKEGQ